MLLSCSFITEPGRTQSFDDQGLVRYANFDVQINYVEFLIVAQVVPLYCFDPRHFITTPWGNPKTGNFRAQFLLESVLDLKQSLRNVGSDLVIKLGRPEDVIPGENFAS